MIDNPFYAVVNAGNNITRRMQALDRALIVHQGNENAQREIITEMLVLINIDAMVMLAYRETLPKPETQEAS